MTQIAPSMACPRWMLACMATLCLNVAASTHASAAAPSFTAQQTFAAGTLPYAVISADINGDGKPDLIVANYSDSTVSVMLNTTAPGAAVPSFAAQQSFATGSGPRAVISADINGDGRPDLVVANYSTNTISVLLNTTAPGAATSSFSVQQTFATGSGPYAVIGVDVNTDGRPDLVVANNSANTVSVLLNTTAPGAATSTFSPQQTFATGTQPRFVAGADINGDGRPDLIVTNFGDNTVSVMLNTTAPGAVTASLSVQQTFAAGTGPDGVAASDINGDGRADLIAANFTDNTISVLLNTTAPGATTSSFSSQLAFATGSGPHGVAAADIDGDGRPDLIIGNFNGNNVSVLVNTTAPGAATPSLAPQATFATGAGPYGVATADINADGKADLVAANNSDNTVSVLLNTTPFPVPPAAGLAVPVLNNPASILLLMGLIGIAALARRRSSGTGRLQ